MWDRSRYPPDWKELSRQVKDEAHWTCERCGEKCELGEMQVHHRDHCPEHNQRDNLMAVCLHCHGILDGNYRAKKGWRKRRAQQTHLPLSRPPL